MSGPGVRRWPFLSLILAGAAAGGWACGGQACPYAITGGVSDAARVEAGDAPDAGAAGAVGAGDAPTLGCSGAGSPSTPVEYGRCELARVAAAVAFTGEAQVIDVSDPRAVGVLSASGAALASGPESFVVVGVAGVTWVVGRDPAGALYGALEAAERLELDGVGALPPTQTIAGAPAVSFRAANPYLVLPIAGESSWWFLDEKFWLAYLDALAHARINFLDLHGMYDARVTALPNALLYFARSPSFPAVGIAAADRERNVVMLNRIVALARIRGIRVGLMSYRADSSTSGTTAETLDAPSLKTYTREAARDLATRVPGLARLGFRIGESGQPAQWYADTFVAGVREAGTGVGVYTRSWVTPKAQILELLASADAGTIVEVKFNGEHLATPYPIAGGNFAQQASYSYQDFLTPPAPYDFVFQVRAAGTDRIFRQASYGRTRRAVKSLALSPAVRGFSLEPPHAYTSEHEDFHAQPADALSPWLFVRDELTYRLWGRLGYDPEVSPRVFRAWLARRTGTDGLWDSVQAASDIVPWMETARACGPDVRDFAPELETAGDVAYWASPPGTNSPTDDCRAQRPLDTFAVASPFEAADDLVAARATSRVSPREVARLILTDADRAAAAAAVPIDAANAEARDFARECVAVADLGRYFAHKLRAATALAVHARSGQLDYLQAARTESDAAGQAWVRLVADTAYIRPFHDPLRMGRFGLDPFHWSMEVPRLAADAAAVAAVAKQVVDSPPAFSGTLPGAAAWLDAALDSGPAAPTLAVSPRDASAATWTVTVSFAQVLPAGAAVRVLWKPFGSETDWTAAPTTPAADGSYAATIAGGGAGALFAAEVELPGRGAWRYPDVRRETPYLALPP
jgi:hypothetical protein